MQATGGAGGVTRAGAERILSERQAQQQTAPSEKPCAPCAASKAQPLADTSAQTERAPDAVALGVGSYLSAKLGPHAPEAIKNVRAFICRTTCREREMLADGSAGELLPRLVNGINHCGRPWAGPRNMLREGCGCDTDEKSQYEQATCPRALWGPGAAFHSSIKLVVVETPKPPVST